MTVNTNLITSDINATINFTRWIFPQTRSRFYFNGSIGIGLAYYTFDIRYMDGTPIPFSDTYVDEKYNGKVRTIHLLKSGVAMTYGIAASVPVTFSLEYNISKPLAIGAKIHYRAYAKDNLEGATYLNWDGVTNDYIAAGTIFLRLKFNALKRDHLRNILWNVFEPDEALLLAQKLDNKIDRLKDRVDTLDNKIDSLIPRIDKLENLLSNNGPDSDGDGVPDVRDKSPKTPKNAAVDFWGRPLELASPNVLNNTGVTFQDIIPSVYFDFDQIDLDNDALITIHKVALKLKADTTLMVEARAYCDIIGSNPYNNLLSQRRADRVKAELIKVWNISANRIIANGKGRLSSPQVRYRPNRRCDFYFNK
jgi:outer membrane protein OmpA-like peptidoglycan-associated protein